MESENISSSEAQYLHCHGRAQSALTHTGDVFSLPSVAADWQPARTFRGKVQFRREKVE